jgi:hypothetical protein
VFTPKTPFGKPTSRARLPRAVELQAHFPSHNIEIPATSTFHQSLCLARLNSS